MSDAPLTTSQVIVRVCLFLVAAIAVSGGTLQFVRGQPDTAPRLDNVHRFMAGVYLSTGFAGDCLRRICAASRRMGELIDDLLELSRSRAPSPDARSKW